MTKDEMLEDMKDVDQENSLQYKLIGMQQEILEMEKDAIKTDQGNKAAGTRLRKGMQKIIDLAKEVRKEVLLKRN
jgi:glutamyl-tRNA reductase